MKGVIGLFSHDDIARKSLYTLYGVQHRGQESSGIVAAGDRSLRSWTGAGLISRVFDEKYSSFNHPDDYIVIGCASGENISNGLPPIIIENNRYKIALTLDGYIKSNDTTSYDKKFAEYLQMNLTNDIVKAFSDTMKSLTDSYFCLVAAIHDKLEMHSYLLAARDFRGIRPLFMAKGKDKLYLASESAAIEVLESMGEVFQEKGDFTPGTIVLMDNQEFRIIHVQDPKPATCVFEWVYFARPDSVIEGVPVHIVRKKLGHALVKTYDLKEKYRTEKEIRKDFAVIPVPDSGRSVTTGVAEALGQPADEGIIKNAYLGRTYIIDDPLFRKIASDLKHNVIRATVKNKTIAICDDSIVRGTVSESVAKSLRQAGATHVDFLVSYAPIFHPCFSDPKDKPLAAQPFEGKTVRHIGQLVAEGLPSIDEVYYNTPENVLNAVGLVNSVCIYCSTGKNPFK
jgi:amidophosphoribosyltransferase